MSKVEIIDARGGDHVLVQGAVIQNVIRNRIGILQDKYKALMARMTNELSSKEAAIPLMIAMALDDNSLNENARFFKSCVEQGAWLDKEIRELTTIGQTFMKDGSYRITIADAARYGV